MSVEAADPTHSTRPRILSGIQPSGRLHLGNYFGAIQQQIQLQENAECFYFIANWHSLTTLRDAPVLLEHTRDVALTYLAFGLDPERTVFYRQSDVPEIAELTWLLMTVTGMGLLEKAHSYKEKVARGITPSVGLFTYPALMAADILAPQADVVPVGKDQEQHVELTRDMAAAFNHAFCRDGEPVFKLPTAKFAKTARVPGTTFEKGAILRITTELEDALGDDRVEAFIEATRQSVTAVLAAHPVDAGQLTTTEELATALEAVGGAIRSEYRTRRQELGVELTEASGSGRFVTRGGDSMSIEFRMPLDRTLFVTSDGQRAAAKMSKSYGNTIEIFATGKPLKKTVMGIETDLKELHEPLEPDGDLVLALYRLFADADEVAQMVTNYKAGGFGYGNAKKALLEKIDAYFAPARERRAELERDPDALEDILRTGGKKAREVAAETLARARDACGIPRGGVFGQ